MNKILVFIQIQNKSSSGSPLENLDSILILRRLRTCYKQKRGRANFLIDRKIKNKLTDKEEELIRTQITHVVNDKPSFENKIDLCILHHGKVKIHFSLEEFSEILVCSVPGLKDHIRNGEFPPPTKDGYSQKLLWKCLSIFLKNPKAESTETIKKMMADLWRISKTEATQIKTNPQYLLNVLIPNNSELKEGKKRKTYEVEVPNFNFFPYMKRNEDKN